MPNTEEYQAQCREMVQARVEEPVLGVGGFTRAGMMNSLLVHYLSPAAAYGMRGKGKKEAGGLPTNVLVGITATKIHVFELKTKGRKQLAGDEVATWGRSSVAVTAEPGATATRLTFRFADGQELALESNRFAAGFNGPAIELLTAGAG